MEQSLGYGGGAGEERGVSTAETHGCGGGEGYQWGEAGAWGTRFFDEAFAGVHEEGGCGGDGGVETGGGRDAAGARRMEQILWGATTTGADERRGDEDTWATTRGMRGARGGSTVSK